MPVWLIVFGLLALFMWARPARSEPVTTPAQPPRNPRRDWDDVVRDAVDKALPGAIERAVDAFGDWLDSVPGTSSGSGAIPWGPAARGAGAGSGGSAVGDYPNTGSGSDGLA